MDDCKTYLEGKIKTAFYELSSVRKTTLGLFEMSRTEHTFAPVDWDSMLCVYKSLVKYNTLVELYQEHFPDSGIETKLDAEVKSLEEWFHNAFTKALNYPNGTFKNEP